jgi:hypothetical protein
MKEYRNLYRVFNESYNQYRYTEEMDLNEQIIPDKVIISRDKHEEEERERRRTNNTAVTTTAPATVRREVPLTVMNIPSQLDEKSVS